MLATIFEVWRVGERRKGFSRKDLSIVQKCPMVHFELVMGLSGLQANQLGELLAYLIADLSDD